MKQPNVPGQRLRSPLPPPRRLRSIRCTGVVSWIAPPIAPNHLTFATKPIASHHCLHPYLLSALQHHYKPQTTVTTDHLLNALNTDHQPPRTSATSLCGAS
ncbi:MAG: hypothetical protein HC899_33235 [Leptolyngbyaceae cyanobacterium SM1_4_3]|nr:hypothetical protein [Leptolyngbyaceae cyanobacterium SM1_4_3]